MTLFSAAFGGVLEGEPQNALASWDRPSHTQKTYHPTLLAGFQGLMTFVNHQPVCLHQQTLLLSEHTLQHKGCSYSFLKEVL